MQVPRRIEQEEVAHLRHTAHVTAQQVRDRGAPVARRVSIRVEQRRLLQDQVGRLQGAGRLFRQRSGHIVVLAFGHEERRVAVLQRIDERRQPHGRAGGDHEYHQPQPQRRAARAARGARQRRVADGLVARSAGRPSAVHRSPRVKGFARMPVTPSLRAMASLAMSRGENRPEAATIAACG